MKIPEYEPQMTNTGAAPAPVGDSSIPLAVAGAVRSLGETISDVGERLFAIDEKSKVMEREAIAQLRSAEFQSAATKSALENREKYATEPNKYEAAQNESIRSLLRNLGSDLDRDTRNRYLVLSAGEKARQEVQVSTDTRDLRFKAMTDMTSLAATHKYNTATNLRNIEDALPLLVSIRDLYRPLEAVGAVPQGHADSVLQKVVALWYKQRHNEDANDVNTYTARFEEGYYKGVVIDGQFYPGVAPDEQRKTYAETMGLEANRTLKADRERDKQLQSIYTALAIGDLEGQDALNFVYTTVRDNGWSLSSEWESRFQSLIKRRIDPEFDDTVAHALLMRELHLSGGNPGVVNGKSFETRLWDAVGAGSLMRKTALSLYEQYLKGTDFWTNANWRAGRDEIEKATPGASSQYGSILSPSLAREADQQRYWMGKALWDAYRQRPDLSASEITNLTRGIIHSVKTEPTLMRIRSAPTAGLLTKEDLAAGKEHLINKIAQLAEISTWAQGATKKEIEQWTKRNGGVPPVILNKYQLYNLQAQAGYVYDPFADKMVWPGEQLDLTKPKTGEK